jgi:hypothetical protein
MSKVVKDVVIVSGKYTNKEGVEKNRYQTIGKIIQSEKGEMLKLDAVPIMDGGWNGWAYLNDPKPKEAV